tara:strand:- start:781 stop:1368 length:588 start_codon:yes stop_codon:yes gene_type:complete
MGFGDWAISQELFQDISDVLPEGKTILEFGSGSGTHELLKHWSVISVEDNAKWLNLASRFNMGPHRSTYIHAPLSPTPKQDKYPDTLWYNHDALSAGLKDNHFDLVIIDGPCTGTFDYVSESDIDGWIGRAGILTFIENHPTLFQGKYIIVDDCERPDELVVAEDIASLVNGELTLAYESDGSFKNKTHAIIRPR